LRQISFLLIIIVAFLFRLWLLPLVFHADILSQAGWGNYVADKGPLDLYSYNVWIFSWPNHPPLTSLYYGWCFDLFREISLRLHQSIFVLNRFGLNEGIYFQFVDSFDNLVSPEIPFPLGFMLSLKLVPVISDMVIGFIIYALTVLVKGGGVRYLLVYLFLPFSWYVSALWGQTDQLGFVFVLISFLFILRLPLLSIVLLFIGISIKPTSIFLVPCYLYTLYRVKPKHLSVFVGIIICVVVNYLIFSVFTDENIFKFTFERLMPRILDRPSRLTTNSYNFWHIFTLDKGWSNQIQFLLIPAYWWGLLVYVCLNCLAFWRLRKVNLESIITSLFVVAFGSWMFLTDMLDRYAFAGIVSGLILTIYRPKLFKYWLILAIVYCLNLFRGWWYPSQLYLLKEILIIRDFQAGLYLSLINTMVYLRMLWLLFANDFLARPHNKEDQIIIKCSKI